MVYTKWSFTILIIIYKNAITKEKLPGFFVIMNNKAYTILLFPGDQLYISKLQNFFLDITALISIKFRQSNYANIKLLFI